MRQNTATPSERTDAASQDVVVGVDGIASNLRDAEVALDGFECGLQVGCAAAGEPVLASPQIENFARRALAQVGVVDGRATDTAPLQNVDREVVRHASRAILEELGQHLFFALGEVGGEMIAPFLERDDVDSGTRELAQRDRAASAGADHHRARVEHEIFVQLATALDDPHGGVAPFVPSATNRGGVQPLSGRFTSGPS